MPVAIYSVDYVNRLELDRSLLMRALSLLADKAGSIEDQKAIQEAHRTLKTAQEPLPNERKSQ